MQSDELIVQQHDQLPIPQRHQIEQDQALLLSMGYEYHVLVQNHICGVN